MFIARMEGYWDPEFKPSIEEVVDYPSYINGMVEWNSGMTMPTERDYIETQ